MKRLASFILAFIFLGSNLGFAVGTHFCGGHAMDAEVVLGHTDLSCGMMPEVTPAPHQHKQSLNTIPCCKNEFQSLQLEDDLQNTLTKIAPEPIASLAPLFVLATPTTTVDAPHSFLSHTRPLRTEKVIVLIQVFRI